MNQLNVGEIIRRSVKISLNDALILGILGAVIFAIAALAVFVIIPPLREMSEQEAITLEKAPILILFILLLITPLIAMYYAFLIKYVHNKINSLEQSPSKHLKTAIKRSFPLAITYILFMLCIMAGFFALIIPGVIIFTVLAVAWPVAVVERVSPIAALKRSATLTKGHRWSVFGIFLLIAIFVAIAEAIGELAYNIIGDNIVGWLVTIPGSYFSLVIYAITQTVLYQHLLRLKEGGVRQEVAAVFD